MKQVWKWGSIASAASLLWLALLLAPGLPSSLTLLLPYVRFACPSSWSSTSLSSFSTFLSSSSWFHLHHPSLHFSLVRYSSCSSWASSSSSTSPLFGHRVSVTVVVVVLLLLRGLRLPHLRLLLFLGISFFEIFIIVIYFSSLYAFCEWIDCYWKGLEGY